MPIALLLQLSILICGQSEVLAAQLYTELNEKVQIKAGMTSAADIVNTLQRQTAYTFVYDPEYLKKCHIKPMSTQVNKLSEVLQWLDERAPLDIVFNDNRIIITKGVQEKPAQVVTGHIVGKVVNNKNEFLPGVTVKVNNGKGTVTQVDGGYDLELEPGKYTLEFSFISYNTKRITDVVVTEKKLTPLNIVLQPSSSALKEVVVTANYQKASVEGLYAIQKNNAAVSDGISAEQIRATPDNNAAQVLKRISGLTVQDDKFVTVRGLSERYNNVILNGANLPSTEPNRRNFSFDVVPSGLIDNVVINKTATPDMSAEFAGGLVQINTKDIPAQNFASITIGSGLNTNSTGKSLYSTERGNKEYFGADDGRRTWWEKDWLRDDYRQAAVAGDNVKTSSMNARIPNNWGLHKYGYSPVQNYQLTVGRRIKLKDATSLGITVAGTYRHEESIVDDQRYQPSFYYYDNANTYNFNTAIGAVANIGFQTKGHKVVLKNLYNRRFSHESAANYGKEFNFRVTSKEEGDDVLYYSDQVVINDLWQSRLEGEHMLHKHLKMDWSADYITVHRDQPDTRASLGYQAYGPKGYYQYLLTEASGFINRGNAIFNSALEEKRKNVTANFSVPFKVGEANQLIKVGYAGAFRKADFKSSALRMLYDPKGNKKEIDEAVLGLPDYELQSLLKPGYLTYRFASISAGDDGEDYSGDQKLHAAYFMADINFLKDFRFIGGVRMENNAMDVHGISYNKTTGIPVDTLVKYRKTDWLPSFNLIYNLTEAMNVRLAYSKTLARADFRERAPFIYYDFRDRNSYRGAVSLKDAKITNVDIRYEYYPGPGEVISVSGFYKRFDSPVEVVASNAGGQLNLFYFNLERSTNKGIEVDFRKSLGFVSPSAAWLKKVFISGNGSWMKANVEYSPDALLKAAADAGAAPGQAPAGKRDRPLQGLSPYVINGGLGYFGNVLGVNMVYNRFGKRILNAGFNPWQDQYENARDVIDLQLSAALLKNKMQIRFNISDLLQQDYIVYQNVKATAPTEIGGGRFVFESAEEQASSPNSNHDPKGTSFNKDLDFVYHKWFKGRNLSLNITYNF
ncbi:TonB-dependent receptor [Chitinophaga sp. S165]|uniref:TonB-dependent receptor n=1 Tax=Chitinophaga sp. S165 TaxID=2135462 RepID=UPI0013049FC2|nr:TonB-dependent receptor [Chitinophaga sp. S165]